MIERTIQLLGLKAKDRVTGFEGTVTSVCFDLYGCVQLAVTPPKLPDGKLGESHWFDVHRLEIRAKDRVMPVPDFTAMASKPSDFRHGPAEKPARNF